MTYFVLLIFSCLCVSPFWCALFQRYAKLSRASWRFEHISLLASSQISLWVWSSACRKRLTETTASTFTC
ncbi:hypothetical protein V5799_012838 [Amblyomma americanum]|uniref:Uncharacterized protein n=1 Tax=Amblyomma americanum TaxID=6943 RepID=A0AAQ4E7Q0_AMBAM